MLTQPGYGSLKGTLFRWVFRKAQRNAATVQNPPSAGGFLSGRLADTEKPLSARSADRSAGLNRLLPAPGFAKDRDAGAEADHVSLLSAKPTASQNKPTRSV